MQARLNLLNHKERMIMAHNEAETLSFIKKSRRNREQTKLSNKIVMYMQETSKNKRTK